MTEKARPCVYAGIHPITYKPPTTNPPCTPHTTHDSPYRARRPPRSAPHPVPPGGPAGGSSYAACVCTPPQQVQTVMPCIHRRGSLITLRGPAHSSNFRTTSRWTHVDPPPCWSMGLLLIACYPLDPTYRMMPLPCLILTYLSSKYPPAWPRAANQSELALQLTDGLMPPTHPQAGQVWTPLLHPPLHTHKLAS